VVICLQRGADLHMAQLMPLPLTVTCSSGIQIGFTFLVPAHLGSPGQRAVKGVCVLYHVVVKVVCLKFFDTSRIFDLGSTGGTSPELGGGGSMYPLSP